MTFPTDSAVSNATDCARSKDSTKKLHIFLIHGTWAGKGRWTHFDSPFRDKLKQELKLPTYKIKYDVDFTPFPWDGKLRVQARHKVVQAFQKEIKNTISKYTPDWEYLLIGHSHGGNIATDVVRSLLRENPQIPIHGVVCLNTPFFKLELRGASNYLRVWLIIALSLSLAFWTMGMHRDYAHGFLPVPPTVLFVGLVSLTILLGLLCIVSRIIGKENQDDRQSWEPRPDVLCLSCPDDEAITFLGLGEGLSNLPQLLLHPVALIMAALIATILLYVNWQGSGLHPPHWALDVITELFMLWVGISLVGGVLGALAVTLMFGLAKRRILKTLLSRTLVSYTPLLAAQSYFIGISAIPLSDLLRHPVRLFHSTIYYTDQTHRAIGEWLDRKAQAHR